MSYSTPNPEKFLGKVSVLLAEDDVILRQLIKAALKRLGFTSIREASGGEDALEIMRREPVDVLVCDWEMGPMDGLALTRYLRTNPHSPSPYVPILMVTGRTSVQDVKLARDSGITEYLAKPFDMSRLCERLANIVERPRDFVIAPRFSGPDRRRKSSVHYQESERRSDDWLEVIQPDEK